MAGKRTLAAALKKLKRSKVSPYATDAWSQIAATKAGTQGSNKPGPKVQGDHASHGITLNAMLAAKKRRKG